MSIKSKIVHLLGGSMPEDRNCGETYTQPIYSETLSYSIDDDNLAYDKMQIARRIGEIMLDNGLIRFNIEQNYDANHNKIYIIQGRAHVGQI